MFLCQIEQWLWQLRDEVQKLQELGIFLKKIGCFDARPSPRSAAKTGSRVVSANGDGSSMPLLSPPLVVTASKSAAVTALSHTKTSRGDGNGNNAAPTNDVAGSEQQTDPPPDDGGKNNDSRGPAGNACGFFYDKGGYDFRAVENQTREATESLGYHLVVLQRSVDQAHINMRIASQEFSALLRKVSSSSDSVKTRLPKFFVPGSPFFFLFDNLLVWQSGSVVYLMTRRCNSMMCLIYSAQVRILLQASSVVKY